MAKPIPIRPEEESARSYADRLILEQLAEMESAVKLGELADRLSAAGLGLAAVRSLIATNPARFTFHERKWVPAARLLGVGRPQNEAIRLLVERFGAPMPFESLVLELARVRGEDTEFLTDALPRVLENDPLLVVTEHNHIALAKWAFLATDESIDRAFDLHSVDLEDLEIAKKKLEGIDWRSPGAVMAALKVGAPISVKSLGAVAWLALNSQDPRAILLYDGKKLFSQAVHAEGYVYGPGGVIHLATDVQKWITTAIKLADKLAPAIEVEDVAPIDVKPEDVQRMVAKIVSSEASVTAIRMLEEFYEITPSNKTYPDDLVNVITALRASDQVWWVGADRFRKKDSAPDFIYSVPEPFEFPESTILNDENELVDVELTDDGLSSSLRKLLMHPLATDVLDEDIMPQAKQLPERVRLVIKSIHRELGTFPMCQIPTGWMDPQPKIQELIVVDPTGRELQVWANHDARLIYNWIDWWYEQPIESGAVFTLGRTNRPNVLEFAWEDQADPLLYISTQRMEQLRELQGRSEAMSALDVLIEIMHHWPKGADFLTLLAEVNVVRRTSRRMVASLLSSYQCFYQRSGSPVWHFDPKKVELGFDKTKRKFVKK